MKILLFGATGMIGSRILTEALSRGHDIVAATRNPGKVKPQTGVTPIALDVNDVEGAIAAAQDCGLIISAVSPRSTDDAHTEAVKFTKALIEVSRKAGIRILTVGGASTLQNPDGSSRMDHTPDFLIPEAGGMREAYGTMVLADVDFTVLAPGGMIEPAERTGEFRLGGRTIVVNSEGEAGKISAEDFAIALLDEAETPQHFRTIFNVAY